MFPFPKESIVCFLDGNKWCAVRINFVNIQESISGWGGSPEEAIKDLLKEEHISVSNL